MFSAYVGPLGGVPVPAPGGHEIARARLGERERALIARIDGMRILLFDGCGLGSTDALRIAARMIRRVPFASSDCGRSIAGERSQDQREARIDGGRGFRS